MTLRGLHHITLISANIERTTRFYTEVLGLRLVKQTVNFDDPSAKHFYFGNEVGAPGTVITYFEWPHLAPGQIGVGLTHHFALAVADESAQARWLVRLRRYGVEVTTPRPRRYFTSIYFRDPDGVIMEIATQGPGFLVDEPEEALGQQAIVPPRAFLKPWRQESVPDLNALAYDGAGILPQMRLSGIHHITLMSSDIERTVLFYTELLGQRLVKRTVNFDDPSTPHYYFGDRLGMPGTVVTYFGYPQMARGRMGVGVAHHFALIVESNDEQREWRDRLRRAGVQTTDIIDRKYFRSIYFTDPDGVIMELATRGPGFLVDEERDQLGRQFIVPAGFPTGTSSAGRA